MLATTNLVDCFAGQLHHVKSVMDNLGFRQRNVRLGRLHERSTHVHCDRFDDIELILRKLRKTLISAFGVVSVGDRLDGAVVQIVDHRDVVLTLAESLFVDPDTVAPGGRLLTAAMSKELS